MPGIPKTQRTAHGMLPTPLQALAQALFPPEDIMPAPMMSAAAKGLKLVKGASSKAATPVAEMLGAEWSHPSPERGAAMLKAFTPKNLSNVMPEVPSQVPTAPDTAGALREAFRAFRGPGAPMAISRAPARTGERVSSIIAGYQGKLGDLLLRGKR